MSRARTLEDALGWEGLAALAQWLGSSTGRRDTRGKENAVHSLVVRPSTIPIRVVKTSVVSSVRDHDMWVLTALDPPVEPARTTSASARSTLRSASPPPRHRRRSSQHTSSPLAVHRDETPTDSDVIMGTMTSDPHPSSSLSTATLPTSLDSECRRLLDELDWSTTSLGPRSTWSPVVEMMIDVVLRSPTQDALWLGSDFNMI